MGLPSYLRSVVDRNVVMRRIPVMFCGTTILPVVRRDFILWKIKLINIFNDFYIKG